MAALRAQIEELNAELVAVRAEAARALAQGWPIAKATPGWSLSQKAPLT